MSSVRSSPDEAQPAGGSAAIEAVARGAAGRAATQVLEPPDPASAAQPEQGRRSWDHPLALTVLAFLAIAAGYLLLRLAARPGVGFL